MVAGLCGFLWATNNNLFEGSHMKMGFIYKITNLVTGAVYVGQTIRTVPKRWDSHVDSSKRPKLTSRLLRAIVKYGKDCFKIETLEEIGKESLESLDALECAYISILRANNPIYGYNLTSGGSGDLEARGKTYSKDNSGENNALFGTKQSPEHVALRTSARIGSTHTDEAKAKISAVHKGKKLSQSQKDSISKNSKSAWADPKYKEQNLASRAASIAIRTATKEAARKKPKKFTSEENREAARLRGAAQWADPISKEKILKARAEGRAARAVAKMKLMVKAHLLTLAPKEIYT
jgi:group I intron endonuclease